MNIHVILCVGNFEVGVHIADVSYFVEEGSVLDYTASRRATSVYLIQKVVILCVCVCMYWDTVITRILLMSVYTVQYYFI